MIVYIYLTHTLNKLFELNTLLGTCMLYFNQHYMLYYSSFILVKYLQMTFIVVYLYIIMVKIKVLYV